MQNSPYSIYVDKRPIKIAFILDPKASIELVDKIIEYNHSKWGGRYNPIILSNGKTIGEEWWEFLMAYDPDYIKSFVPLSNKLIGRIENFLSPYFIEVSRNSTDQPAHAVHIQDEGLSILPTAQNVASVSHSFGEESNLVLFNINKVKDGASLKHFVKNNFGIYVHTIDVDKVLERQSRRSLEVTDKQSLINAATVLSTNERFVYPSQLCALPTNPFSSEYDRLAELLTVVIGDSIEDLVYSWNHSLYVPGWRSTYLNQIWLPLDIANDKDLEPCLAGWLQRLAWGSNSSQPEINFVSFSLKQSELKDIAERLTKNKGIISRITKLTDWPIPKYTEGTTFIRLQSGMDLYRATSNEENIVLKEPDLLEGVMGGEHWMADIYIQSKSEVFDHIVNGNYWVNLPSRNFLAQEMFKKPSRISSNGLPSVLMERGENSLDIKVLSNSRPLSILLSCGNMPCYNADPRKDRQKFYLYNTRRSDKGRYLSGMLQLFSGLFYASHIFEERYWRKMFEQLSAQDQDKENSRVQELINKIRKKPKEFFTQDKGEEWLAKVIFQTAKTISTQGNDLPFEYFSKEAEKELEEYNAQSNPKFKFDKSDIKNAISDLMERNILIAGSKSHCPFCGYANWHSSKDLNQVLECAGCGNEYPLEAEAVWYYRLNSLVQSGYSRFGLTPVILVLGQLLFDSRTSFFMSPSLELYEKNRHDPVGELDIICIQDGKLILGEVKQSVDLFHSDDFVKIKKIALVVRPNKIIFSSMDNTPSRLVKENIELLKKDLTIIGTEVEWYQLRSYIFEPSVIR